MDDTTGMLDRMRVRAMSPDKSVRATFSPEHGLLVESRPASMKSHSETTLADQIEKTLAGITSGYGAAKEKLQHNATEGGADPIQRDDAAARARRRAFEAIRVNGTSERGFVDVQLWSVDDLRVRITPNAIARCGPTVMMAEVNSALDNALRAYRTEALATFDVIYNKKQLPNREGAANGRN